MARLRTLLLDRTAWDLVSDAHGNIAVADPPYALSQDVATAILTVKGELWYDQDDGVPLWDSIMGKLPPVSVLTSYFTQAALTVPGVVSAQTVITNFDRTNRTVNGQVQFVDESGVSGVVNI